MKFAIVLATTLAYSAALPAFLPEWLSQPFSMNIAAQLGNEPRLIKLGPEEYKIVTESQKLKLRRSNIGFIDVTKQISVDDAVAQGLIGKPPSDSLYRNIVTFGSKQIHTLKDKIPTYNYPTATSFNKEVNALIEKINTDSMFQNLSKFTSFYTRYYKSQTGYESATWLHEQISALVEPVKDKVTITKVHHEGWDQFSIVVSIPGKVADKVVVGAHQDSINLLFPNLMKAPGADDDGSGTVTILEVLRLIIGDYSTEAFKPHNTLEFHFYSAEEGGLLGSVDVFSNYSRNGETVVGMLQQDMTGYTAGTIDAGIEPHIGLITDYTSVNLNNFLKLLVNTYNAIPYHESSCGYACSDHASALENGYPAAFLIEAEMKYTSKYIHSVMDTIDRIDWDHVKEHVKLTIAYAYELASAKHLH
ncbi:leucyl aminopeptidase precursor [Scheffersomyces xylosifermentans]|uniref:leucyl aminopeptidase precursor n=1 Tax=Scheffersomyces xylosifermentans TaxID=1304137 RepID=UPI00315DF1BF